jgi:tetratricopeptide (TPR) repeat protein
MALALAGSAAAAHASVLVVGGGLAESCYRAADARDKSHDALQLCNRALVGEALTKSDRVATYVNRGIVHFARGTQHHAMADFDRALALDPTEPDAWLNKAVVTVQYGKGEDALPMIQKALELNTRRPALAYYVRGIVEERRGNIRAAYHDFRRAQQLEPKWREPAVELSRYQVRQL